MMNKRNNLDEMQEQKLLHIEHNGCWLAFWGLLAAMIAECIFFSALEHPETLLGEWIVFLCLALYLAIDCARNGIWDRRLRMNQPTILVCSLIAGGFVFVFQFLVIARRFPGQPAGSTAAALFTGILCFALVWIALTLTAHATKKRQDALNAEPKDGEI